MSNPSPYKSTAVAPIPFRDEPAVNSSQMMSTLVITVLLLCVAWWVAHYARRKGWLNHWIPANSLLKPEDARLRVLSSKRISRQTVVHEVEGSLVRYLVVESKANVSVTLLPEASPPAAEYGRNNEH